jgi:putative DNA methylase
VTDRPRLIEVAFPLKETSIDSVHEKNVRHGHISTLHIWPARRPLAACRAALIATLLPDPGNDEERKMLLEKIGGKVVVNEKTGKEETEGGILHWGRESGPDMDWFREKIREAYGGRAPRVLDPFSGGGAIPLEAMRLGCEVTAVDINPVAWFILKCTLEYPQKLAGKKVPLPKFAMELPGFRKAWEDAQTKAGKKGGKQKPGTHEMWDTGTPEADLAWHVRAWGHWVLERARKELEQFYPVVDGKSAVAYLWARTVRCKACGATIPLLKTRWLCKKDSKYVTLTLAQKKDGSGVDFGIAHLTATQAKDKGTTAGTMSRSGAQCQCCPAIMTMEDIRLEGQAGRLGATMTAVAIDGQDGKEFRCPTTEETTAAASAVDELERIFSGVPFGSLDEPIPQGASRSVGGSAFTVYIYGLDRWSKLFTPRQLVALGTLLRQIRETRAPMRDLGYSSEWTEAMQCYLAVALDRTANYASTICIWEPVAAEIKQTFLRFALPITWDFAEANPLCAADRYYSGALSNIADVLHNLLYSAHAASVRVLAQSAVDDLAQEGTIDAIITDPPYYDAIPYSDLMDFFYLWLRRTLWGLKSEMDAAFSGPLSPKWNHERSDGELIDDAGRFDGDKDRSRQAYEHGMARVFDACYRALRPDGRLVIVFAHKKPDAWEALVSAMIRSGCVVDGSWPIATEMRGGVRNHGRASLASSVWLVCKKRPDAARPGWDNRVLEDMRQRIHTRLRAFWDAGLRGPDVVWAATGPALEAYSKHPVVKKANEPGQVMTVSEFLRHVRRIVVDFVVGRVLTHSDGETVSGLDDVTTYYLLHRHDFRMEDALAGAVILYAVSCDLSDRDLSSDRFDLLVRTGGKGAIEEEPGGEDADGNEAEPEVATGSGNKVKLKAWDQRRGKNLGLDTEGKPAPLIDQVHHVMHLWRAQDQTKVNQYLDARALWKSQIFHQILQALVELAPEASEERSLLEAISNHVGAGGRSAPSGQIPLPHADTTDE